MPVTSEVEKTILDLALNILIDCELLTKIELNQELRESPNPEALKIEIRFLWLTVLNIWM